MLDVMARSLMRAWYLSRESALAAVPYPQDAPIGRAPGPNRIRTLLLGNGAASGWGVRSHDLALPGHLARALSALTGRGVQVDARVDRMRRMADLPQLLVDVDLGRYDVVVVVAGMSDAVNLTPLPAWRRSSEELLDRIRIGAPAPTVLVLGPQPVQSVSTYTGRLGSVAERHRQAMNRISAVVCETRGVHFDVLPAPDLPPGVPGHRSPDVYLDWAAAIAARLGPLLAAPGSESAPQQEEGRQRAAEAMLPDAPKDESLDRITRLARELFDVELAAVTIVDGDLQKTRSVAGGALAAVPRTSSICDRTIRSDEPTVIGDLAGDPRFADNPLLTGDPGIRFYAGYPIESPDGFRVGALCLLGAEPRDPRDVDTRALAELALRAQKELWASVDRAAAAASR